LSDFGLAIVLQSTNSATATASMRGTLRWMAPELLQEDPEQGHTGKTTPWSDMYAVGMLLWEVRVSVFLLLATTSLECSCSRVRSHTTKSAMISEFLRWSLVEKDHHDRREPKR
jgi:serine/threonine protein kinase